MYEGLDEHIIIASTVKAADRCRSYPLPNNYDNTHTHTSLTATYTGTNIQINTTASPPTGTTAFTHSSADVCSFGVA